MFESYEDILTIQDVADILKVGTTQVCKQRPTTAGFAEQNGRNAKLNGQGSF